MSPQFSEGRIANALAVRFGYIKNLIIANYGGGLAGYESDLAVVRPSGWAIEIEIKISQADFRAEFKNKAERHRILKEGHPEKVVKPSAWDNRQLKAAELKRFDELLQSPQCEVIGRYGAQAEGEPYILQNWGNTSRHFTRYFYFAMPEELAEKLEGEIPSHCGLLAVGGGWGVRELIKAPTLSNSQKVTVEKRIKMLESAYHRYHQYRYRLPNFDIRSQPELSEVSA